METALPLAITLIEQAITHEPQIAAAIKSFFTKPDPTPLEWATLRAHIASLSYSALVPNSQLPPTTPA